MNDDPYILRILKKEYSLKSAKLTPVRISHKHGVWYVLNNDDEYMFKQIPVESKFPIVLNDKLGSRNVMPRVIRTNKGDILVRKQNKYYFLSNWVKGHPTTDPAQYIKAVARFHRKARFPGILLGRETYAAYGPRTKEEWLNYYREKTLDLYSWQRQAVHPELKQSFEKMIGIAEAMTGSMKRLDLDHYIRTAVREKMIVHLDLHSKNILFRRGRPLVIDLDWGCIAPHVYDFHRVVPSLLQLRVKPKKFISLLNSYFSIYPDASRFKKIYLTVCQYPYYFYLFAQRYARTGELNEVALKLVDIAGLERKKYKVMKREKQMIR